MMFVPGFVSPWILSASVDAIPPPTAWMTRAMMSHVRKTMAYILGLKMED